MIATLVTGGFDPLHSGHIEYLKAAAKFGDDLFVGLNSDEWLIRKKGRFFLPIEERRALVENLSVPLSTIGFDDTDNTARHAIEQLCEMDDYNIIRVCNGGDRTEGNIPEAKFHYNKKIVWCHGIGGTDKKNSSSWILDRYENQWVERNWGRYKVVDNRDGSRTKIFEINPGGSMSYQRHQYRDEVWTCLEGQVSMQLSTDYIVRLKEQQSERILKGNWHRGYNETDKLCVVLETWFGSELSEQDIERQ